MSTALRWLFRGVLLLFAAISLGCIAIALFTPELLVGSDGSEEMRWGVLAGGVLSLAVVVFRGLQKDELTAFGDSLGEHMKARRAREAQVKTAGLAARAVIVARENEREDDGDVNADLTLEISLPGRAPYRVPYHWSEPERHAEARMRTGRELEARVDPTDSSFVVVRWDNSRWYSTRRM
ncbi:Hypothetical protein A7982_11017 [Minicystis rosea]|nr:Hypothetical protein A7982_11017 [Minicystis rosea]